MWADELRDFLASIEESEWYVPIYLAANTGIRRGEVLGLTWRNVDLDAGRLTVSHQIQSVEYEARVADVTEAFADDLHGDAGLQQDGGVYVAEIVEADRPWLAFAHQST